MIPFSEFHLKFARALCRFQSPFLQTAAYFTHNNFEIRLLVEKMPASPGSIREDLPRETVESLFLQFMTLFRFSRDREIDFIDFNCFYINSGFLKFPLLLPVTGQEHQRVTEEDIIGVFRGHSRFKQLTPENVSDTLEDLKEKHKFKPGDAYIYYYDDFASTFLESFPFDDLENRSGIKIHIRTSGAEHENIIRLRLYKNIISDTVFTVEGGSDPRPLSTVISEYLPDAPDPGDPVVVAGSLERFMKSAAHQTLVLMPHRVRDAGDARFIDYLLREPRGYNIVLIGFDVPHGLLEFDLQLKENPPNYLEEYLNFERRKKKKSFTPRQEECLKILSLLPIPYKNNILDKILPGGAEIIDALLEKNILSLRDNHLEPVPGAPVPRISSSQALDILRQYAAITDSWEELADHLIRMNRLELAGMFVSEYHQTDPIAATIKEAHLCRLAKDHPRLGQLLAKLEKNGKKIPPHLRDEYYYINNIYYENQSPGRADDYYKRIREPMFRHLANIKRSDRYIYDGRYGEAVPLLEQAASFLQSAGYTRDALEAKNQTAKLLREKKDFDGAGKLYKNLFIQCESSGFHLLAAAISLDLGNLYYTLEDHSQAELWYRGALKIYLTQKNENGKMMARSNLAEIDKIKGNWPEAAGYLKSVLAFDTQRQLSRATAIDYLNIAHLEFLKHNPHGAREYLGQAVPLFQKENYMDGLMECGLLGKKLDFLFPPSPPDKTGTGNPEPSLPVSGDEKTFLEILNTLSTNPGSIDVNDGDVLNGKIQQICSPLLRFELILLWIHRFAPTHLEEHLKSLSMQLSRETKNYYYYEYYYTWFTCCLDSPEVPPDQKEIFLDTYYFFTRNKRRLAPRMNRLKKQLDEQESQYDVFKSARLVADYRHWKIPGDLFDTFVPELDNILAAPADLIKLVIYENREPLFNFSKAPDSRFDKLTDEMVLKSLEHARDLDLTTGKVKRYFNDPARTFYHYRHTKIYPWRISRDLLGVVLLAFAGDHHEGIHLFDRHQPFFQQFAPLIAEYHEKDYKVNRLLKGIIGESPVMRRLKEHMRRVGKVDFAVLIRGESGSGKELAAQGIHRLSRRAAQPFIAVNAAAIPDNLLEAELFGYKKGAFTGASESKTGLIEAAHGGTLFLDEIADLPMTLQAKLLRVLQENEIRRLGENRTVKVDFRLICATNKDLNELIKENGFREDLYFRIQDLVLQLPPLRDRVGDIPLLVKYFLEKYCFNIDDQMELQRICHHFENHDWPGNVRQLEAAVKRLITFYPDFDLDDAGSSAGSSPGNGGLLATRDNLEKTMVYNALQKNNGSRTQAAGDLKISRQYLFKLIKKYNIEF